MSKPVKAVVTIWLNVKGKTVAERNRNAYNVLVEALEPLSINFCIDTSKNPQAFSIPETGPAPRPGKKQ